MFQQVKRIAITTRIVVAQTFQQLLSAIPAAAVFKPTGPNEPTRVIDAPERLPNCLSHHVPAKCCRITSLRD